MEFFGLLFLLKSKELHFLSVQQTSPGCRVMLCGMLLNVAFFFFLCLKVKLKVAQLCLTLCDPMDYPIHRILQARILEWVAFPFSKGSSNSGIEPRSPALQAASLPVSHDFSA